MEPFVKYKSRSVEQTASGFVTTLTYSGSREQMLEFQEAHKINRISPEGRLVGNRVTQDEGHFWQCELRYEKNVDKLCSMPPPTEYGKKSAQLSGTMLSMPLEAHKDYRARWNYFLAAAPGISQTPSWWESATSTALSENDGQKYRWIKSPGECPSDAKGLWRIIRDPKMPGVETYDVAVYTVVETAKFRSAWKAGEMVKDHLNKIGRPSEDFGLSGRNWKCDDAQVAWTGKYWLATLTWTRAGDRKGWNKDLYD